MNTTIEARDRFQPPDRGCYVEKELPLQYLPSRLYRYEMSNCLFEAAYERILSTCHCAPSFHQLGAKSVNGNLCSGPGLTCMNKILRFIGKLNKVRTRKKSSRTCHMRNSKSFELQDVLNFAKGKVLLETLMSRIVATFWRTILWSSEKRIWILRPHFSKKSSLVQKFNFEETLLLEYWEFCLEIGRIYWIF